MSKPLQSESRQIASTLPTALYGGLRDGNCWACRQLGEWTNAVWWDENGDWCHDHAPEWTTRLLPWHRRAFQSVRRWLRRL